MSLSKALYALLEKHTGTCAEKEVVAWRNSICRGCPKRRAPKTALETTMVRLEGVPKQPVLGDVCDVCGCSLGLLNTAKSKNIPDDPEEMKQRPDICWIHSATT